MALIDDVKLILRIDVDDYDAEINALIDSAKLFIIDSGAPEINVNPDPNDSVKQLIFIYCKTFFGYNDKDEQRQLPAHFEILLNQVSLKNV